MRQSWFSPCTPFPGHARKYGAYVRQKLREIDLFVLPEYQGRGIGSEAIRLTEEIVKTYSESLYIEAAARNIKAIELYRKLGYDCLNTITVRKDFKPEKFEILREEKIFEQNFEVKILRTSGLT